MSCSSPRRLTSNPLSSASEPSSLKTAYRFFSSLSSSLDEGRIIARYGPSSSKKIEFSDVTSYLPRSASTSVWY